MDLLPFEVIAAVLKTKAISIVAVRLLQVGQDFDDVSSDLGIRTNGYLILVFKDYPCLCQVLALVLGQLRIPKILWVIEVVCVMIDLH